MNWVLSCDFGTSNTTAAEIDEDGRIRAIGLEDQGTSMPSAVALTPSGTRVGQSAVNAQLVHPEGFESAPKMLIGQESVVYGKRFVKPEELVEAVYSTVRKVALARHNGREPRELWLTHPVAWAPSQLEVLKRGAARAGFDPATIRLVPEPIAAATHYATSRSIQPGTRVAVFDFGGGTLDIAVLERAPQAEGGYRVLAYGGDPLLGGRSFDNRLIEWALKTARESGHADLVERIENPRDAKELRAKLALRRAVTAAKIELSTHADADIPMQVGELEHVVTITRDEYEQLISADVERGGKLVRDVLDRVGGAKPEAIYLTGGSSRTPSIARMLHRVTGLIPATFDDPKLVVSEGALRVRPAVTVGSQQRPGNQPIPAIASSPGVQGPRRPGAPGLRPAPAGRPLPQGQGGQRPSGPRPQGTGPQGPHGTGPQGPQRALPQGASGPVGPQWQQLAGKRAPMPSNRPPQAGQGGHVVGRGQPSQARPPQRPAAQQASSPQAPAQRSAPALGQPGSPRPAPQRSAAPAVSAPRPAAQAPRPASQPGSFAAGGASAGAGSAASTGAMASGGSGSKRGLWLGLIIAAALIAIVVIAIAIIGNLNGTRADGEAPAMLAASGHLWSAAPAAIPIFGASAA